MMLSNAKRRAVSCWPLLAVFVVALLARAVTPATLPSTDEAITLAMVETYGTFKLLWMIPLIQPHFPAYYVLLDVWGMVFPVESARWLSAIAGALVPVVAMAWFQDLFSRPLVALAGLTLAYSPPLIAQAHWLRMYSLLALAVLVSWWVAWDYQQGKRRARTYGLTAAVTMVLHPFGLAVVGAQLLWLAGEQYGAATLERFRHVSGTLIGFGGVLCVPLLARIGGYAGEYSIPRAGLHVRYADGVVPLLILPITTLTGTALTSTALLVSVVSTGVLTVAVLRARIWTTELGRLSLSWVGLSLALLVIGHLVRPVIMLKYTLWMAPGVVLVLLSVIDTPDGKLASLGVMAVYMVNLGLLVLHGAQIAMVTIWNSGVAGGTV